MIPTGTICEKCGGIIMEGLAGLVDHHGHKCPYRPVQCWEEFYREGKHDRVGVPPTSPGLRRDDQRRRTRQIA